MSRLRWTEPLPPRPRCIVCNKKIRALGRVNEVRVDTGNGHFRHDQTSQTFVGWDYDGVFCTKSCGSVWALNEIKRRRAADTQEAPRDG